MKKVIFVAVLFFVGLSQSNAQFSFNPGLRGGANFSHFTKGEDYDYNTDTYSDANYGSTTDFYLGFYGALHLAKYYTLQPEIDYSRQGSKTNYGDLKVAYLSIGVINKFTFTDKFNVHIGPTIDFVVEKNFAASNNFDLAFVLGAGYNFTKNIGIEARVKKGIVPVRDNSDYDGGSSHTNVVFSLGASYTFDLK